MDIRTPRLKINIFFESNLLKSKTSVRVVATPQDGRHAGGAREHSRQGVHPARDGARVARSRDQHFVVCVSSGPECRSKKRDARKNGGRSLRASTYRPRWELSGVRRNAWLEDINKVRPIPLLRLSLLGFADSNFPGNPWWI